MSYKNIEIQEELLQVPHFSNDDAIAIGLLIYERAKKEGYPIGIDISRNRTTLFHMTLPGANIQNEQWMSRKRNTSYYFERSTLYYESPLREEILNAGFDYRDYAPAGGAFPIRIAGSGYVGAAIVSGLASIEDHNLVAWAIAKHYGIDGVPDAEIV
ncbi:MAG: heme-binding protein [Clostridiales Family XIII bacterium]|nr:heme-binding protein [Clostridiales Family XIII bacterium]